MFRVYTAIGSNQYNARVQTLRAVRALAAQSDWTLVNWSHNYASTPLVVEGGSGECDAYQNLVAVLDTSLAPEQLLARLLALETALGRRRNKGARWQSRMIDLDVALAYDMAGPTPEMIHLKTKSLQVPHYHVAERNFVLAPLAEVLHVWPDCLPTEWTQDGLVRSSRFAASCVRTH